MKIKLIGVIAAVVIVLGAAAALGVTLYRSFKESHAPSEVVMPLPQFYNVADGEAMIILDEKVYEKTALWQNDTAYIDLDTVAAMYIHRFFWIAEENLMIYTTPTEVFHFTPGQKAYTVNDTPAEAKAPVVILGRDGMPYIEITYLENCGINYRIYDEPHRVMITYSDESFLAADVIEQTQIRVSQDIRADLLVTLEPGEKVRFIDGGGIRENGFVKVMSETGVRGYILEKCLTESYYTDPVFRDFKWPEYTHLIYADKVYLGWQLLYTKDSVGYLTEAAANAPEMNGSSPTWFFLTGTDGGMMSYANKDYVTKAHELGLKVWALYKNDTIEGQFTCTEDSHAVLSSTAARTALIGNIIESVHEYGFDGVNIDFEMLKVDSGVYFIEFLRELSVKCRAEGIILSVDNYVPENYNAYYDLAEQSRIIDYIVIMGYDQHYAGSQEAGSVSALDWFTASAENTAAKADMKRVIMGVPFYTRLWKITNGSIIVEETPNMAAAAARVKKAGAELTWKDAEGQYYAEWNSGGSKFKIWLEDEASLRAKTYAVRELGVAGIAAWKCGDEAAGTWAAIKDALEGELPVPEEEESDETGESSTNVE